MSEEVTEIEQPQVNEELASKMDALGGLIDTDSLQKDLDAVKAPVDTEKPKDTPTSIGEALAQKAAEQAGIEKSKETVNPDSTEAQKPASTETKPEDSTEAKTEGDKTKPEVKSIESDLFADGKMEFGPDSTEGDKKIEASEDVLKFVKDHFGIEGAEKLIESTSKWRKDSQELVESSKKVGQYDALLKSLPSELYNSIVAFGSGEDWKNNILNSPNIDFSKSSDHYTNEKMIELYHPGKVSKEDWEAYNDEDNENHGRIKTVIDVLSDSAKEKFNTHKKGLDTNRASYIENAKVQVELVGKSVEGSEAHFRKALPSGINQNTIDKYSEMLRSGSTNDLFYNKDGTAKEGAMLTMAMAENGYSLFDQMKGIISNKAKTDERIEVLERTSDKPRNGNTSGSKDEVSKDVQGLLNEMLQLNSKQQF